MASVAVTGGAGYVGVAYSLLLADLGHHVVSLDTDPVRIGQLYQGHAPFHEPGLQELLDRVLASDRIAFTTNYAQAIPQADFVFICVGTPPTPSGAADTSAITEAAQHIARYGQGHTVVVNKSTMPVGSVSFVADILAEHAAPGATFSVVSNPEFLREGSAVHDIYHPDRIVLGSDDPAAAQAVGELYASIDAPTLFTLPRSAEMIKYASNAFLASKISFINEVATICEHLDADVNAVVEGMGLDQRITPHFLRPGIGFGGSCFPKDVRALASMALEHGCNPTMLNTVLDINSSMRSRVLQKVERHLGDLRGSTVAVLGLSFKPHTDDTRESPAIALMEDLIAAGATVRATDPVAIPRVASRFMDVTFCEDAYGAVMGADAVVLVTEWDEYRVLDADRIANAMRGTLVVDGRNVLEAEAIAGAGLAYEGVGRTRAKAQGPSIKTAIILTPADDPALHQTVIARNSAD